MEIESRLKEIEAKPLDHGSHKSFEEGACIMEMVSYVANEPWSDHPQCACPILTEYAIRLNDRFNDKHRQLMKPFIPLLVGTRSTKEVQIGRKRLIRWRNVTGTYPAILETLQLTEIAAKLRTFENTLESMAEAKKFLQAKREEIYKTANAYANAYADADAYANAYANAYAYADAYAYAYADADAYAYAWREKVVTIVLETLRLAIEVKP